MRVTCNIACAVVIAAPAAAADPVHIAALGDSLTQGYGLPQEDGFVPQLEDWLNEAGADVVLSNAGVSGDTTAGGLSRVEWTLGSGEVDAVIVALGGNDVLRGIEPAESRSNLDAILEATNEAGVEELLIGIDPPENYGAEYGADFRAMYAELAEAHDTLLVENFLGPLQEEADRREALSRYMQADGIHPNAAGVERIVEAIGPAVLDLVRRVNPEAAPAE